MLSYPTRVAPGEHGEVVLTFPDFPQILVVAETEGDAFDRALPALESALAAYVVEGRPIPTPSDICGAPTVRTAKFSLVGIELG